MNKTYQVLVWQNYEFEEQLGSPQDEQDFDHIHEATLYYNSISKYMCKMIMRYDSLDSDSDGTVLEEEWKPLKLIVCEDNGMFYIQTDPEQEDWIASFPSQYKAEEYIQLVENQDT
jgi:hypothetical protein